MAVARDVQLPPPARITTYEWGEVKSLFLRVVRNGQIEENFKRQGNRTLVADFCQRWLGGDSQYGQPAEETIRQCIEGYSIPGVRIEDNSIAPLRKRRKYMLSDCEGDFMYDQYYSGSDMYYSTFSKRERSPAVDVLFDLSISAWVPPEVVKAYKEWMLRQCVNMEASGIDYSLRFVFQASNVYRRERNGTYKSGSDEVQVIVKRMNEASDPYEWGALVGPSGFRQILFLALMKHADNNNGTIEWGLGSPRSSTEYKAIYNPTWERVEIYPHVSSKTFEPAALTEQFIAALEQAKR